MFRFHLYFWWWRGVGGGWGWGGGLLFKVLLKLDVVSIRDCDVNENRPKFRYLI